MVSLKDMEIDIAYAGRVSLWARYVNRDHEWNETTSVFGKVSKLEERFLPAGALGNLLFCYAREWPCYGPWSTKLCYIAFLSLV